MKLNKTVIATHVVYNTELKDTYGPGHNIYDYLIKDKKNTVYFIKHCLYGKNPTKILNSKKEINKEVLNHKHTWIHWIQTIFINLQTIQQELKPIRYIGIDPVNGFSGVISKLMQGNLVYFIYFSADYADKRFASNILNFIYHLIDRICLIFADEVWGVSSRIKNKRKKQGVTDKINHVIPNSPPIRELKKINIHNKDQSLVIVTHITKSLELQPILKSLKKLIHKHPKIRLDIVGSGPEEGYFKEMVMKMKLNNYVNFLGFKKHEEILNILAKSKIGFAIYTNENSWNSYGDSMKAREYAALGVPIIINDIPSTADDVLHYDAGIVLKEINVEQITNFIDKCLTDQDFYKNKQNNALKMAKENDKEEILKKLLE